jgi:hypothetical protein
MAMVENIITRVLEYERGMAPITEDVVMRSPITEDIILKP